MSRIIQLRRDASTSWTAVNPTLTQGEFGYETDTSKFKIGNGVDDWNTLGYLFQGEEGGTVSYDDLSDLPTLFDGAYSSLTGTPTLATVATSGSYTDLSGTPTLATVATSGAYADITGAPSIPSTIGGTFQAVSSGALANGDKVVVNSDGTVSVVAGDENAVGPVSTSTIHSHSGSNLNGDWYVGGIYDTSANKLVVCYRDKANNGYPTVVLGTISGDTITYGSPTVIDSQSALNLKIGFNPSAGSFFITYQPQVQGGGSGNYSQMWVGQVSGNSVSGSRTDLSNYNRGGMGSSFFVYEPSSGKTVWVQVTNGISSVGANLPDYRVSAVAMSFSGTTVTFGSHIRIDNEPNDKYPYAREQHVVNNGKIYIAYEDGADDERMKVAMLSLSGHTVSVDTTVTATSVTSEKAVMAMDTNQNKLILAYNDASASEKQAYLKVGTISGNTISFGPNIALDSTFSPTNLTPSMPFFDAASSTVTLFYSDFTTNPQELRTYTGTISGDSISIERSDDIHSLSYQNKSAILGPQNRIIAFIEGGAWNSRTAISVIFRHVAGTPTTNLTAENYVGISDGAYSNGANATIQSAGAVDDAQSGLTAGQTYYVSPYGGLSLTAGDPSVFAGVALSSTEILIAKNDSGGGVSNYNDLTNLPTLFDGAYSSLTGAPTLATVATSGSYTDLTSAPAIPSALTDIGISDGADGQVLTTDGSGSFTFQTVSSGSSGADTLNELTDVSTSGVTNGQILKYNGSSWAPAEDSVGSGIDNVVEDTSPQLGGSLDVNGNDIVSTSNGDIDLDPDGSGNVIFKGNSTRGAGAFKLNCEFNSHGITVQGPPHSANADYTLTLPNNDGNADQVLTTDGSGNLGWANNNSAGGGAWSLFSSTTVTSAVSQIDMALSSSYSTYMIVVENLDPCGALYFRWKRGGTWVWFDYNYTETGTSIVQRANQARFKIAGFDSDNHASAMIFLNNVNETGGQNPSLFSQAVETNKQMTIAGNNSSSITGAVTDIRLYFDSNPTSGSVYIYRLQTS